MLSLSLHHCIIDYIISGHLCVYISSGLLCVVCVFIINNLRVLSQAIILNNDFVLAVIIIIIV